MSETARRAEIWRVAGAVCDPEIPVLTIADMGVLRDVRVVGEVIEIDITPTYSGCPAMNMIALELETTLEAAGFGRPRINLVLSPAWTTDFLTDDAREKLRAYGIAPPAKAAGRRGLFGVEHVPCPRCGSYLTEEIAPFGSTSCKSLWRCQSCREPFDYFKCH
ncbi:1,2-phenylacetyl-CoA epoxidase subunit PaaD [Acidocella sp.]|uniref:1,2-phenylacetyl-CoA epoxidase subunit PaaD n=1 Tax=Acidocella sp. TaxID=50710 RepID=UPI00260CC184|nr:1,2-phenylacetyl-CoA epoxidase subunit PaaD [Acidocella sp.]